MIYLDNNATTPPHPEVVDVISRVSRDAFANPGSPHAFGRRARRVLESCRESFAHLLGAHPDEVVFTSGGTEANNLAVRGLTAGTPGLIALTRGEHPAVLQACLSRETAGFELAWLPVDAEGRLVLTDPVEQSPWFTSRLRLVSLILAHNETGVLQDPLPLAQACLRHRVPLHIDALQAVGKIPVSFRALDCATLAVGAHKFQGPRGIGALLIRRGWNLAPQAWGGHQESERRPGTEAVPLIAGMVRALELFHADVDERMARQTRLRDRLEQGLRQGCPPVVLNGSRTHRLPNTLNVGFPGLDGEALLVALDLAGVACSLGSACASGSAEPAPVLVAMGRPAELLLSSVRFSLGPQTTDADIDEAIRIVSETVQRMRSTHAAEFRGEVVTTG
jgi:cysteine desulfurase